MYELSNEQLNVITGKGIDLLTLSEIFYNLSLISDNVGYYLWDHLRGRFDDFAEGLGAMVDGLAYLFEGYFSLGWYEFNAGLFKFKYALALYHPFPTLNEI